MAIIYTLNAAVGSYTDRGGKEKTNWVKVGHVFESKNGRVSIKIDAVPAGNNWDGWLQCFDPPDYKGRGKESVRDVSDGGANGSGGDGATSTAAAQKQDDIPF